MVQDNAPETQGATVGQAPPAEPTAESFEQLKARMDARISQLEAEKSQVGSENENLRKTISSQGKRINTLNKQADFGAKVGTIEAKLNALEGQFFGDDPELKRSYEEKVKAHLPGPEEKRAQGYAKEMQQFLADHNLTPDNLREFGDETFNRITGQWDDGTYDLAFNSLKEAVQKREAALAGQQAKVAAEVAEREKVAKTLVRVTDPAAGGGPLPLTWKRYQQMLPDERFEKSAQIRAAVDAGILKPE